MLEITLLVLIVQLHVYVKQFSLPQSKNETHVTSTMYKLHKNVSDSMSFDKPLLVNSCRSTKMSMKLRQHCGWVEAGLQAKVHEADQSQHS